MPTLRERWTARDWTTPRVWGVVLAVVLVGWLLVWRYPARDAERDCHRRYAQARTLADTLRIDQQGGADESRAGPWNCGIIRRAQTTSGG